MGSKSLFQENILTETLRSSEFVDFYFAGFLAHEYLNELQALHEKEPNNRYGVTQYGNAIRYGKYAVISILGKHLPAQGDINKKYASEEIKALVDSILQSWPGFEKYVIGKEENSRYFITTIDEETNEKHVELNFDNYYKGNSLLSDLDFFNVEI